MYSVHVQYCDIHEVDTEFQSSYGGSRWTLNWLGFHDQNDYYVCIHDSCHIQSQTKRITNPGPVPAQAHPYDFQNEITQHYDLTWMCIVKEAIRN